MKAKITFFTTILLRIGNFMFLTFNSFAQSPNYLKVERAGGLGWDYANSVAVDANGNTYMVGEFSSDSITFGATTIHNDSINGNGYGTTDMFIVKYDASGNVIWAKSAGGTGGDAANAINVDVNGDIYVVGSFQSHSITFGSITLTNVNADTSDIFIVKYDSSGNPLWAKSAGGTNDDIVNAIAVDANGNAYVAGYFLSHSISFSSTTLINASTQDRADIFIVKYDTSGSVIWARREGGDHPDVANSIAVDAKGNIYVAGNFGLNSITFGTTTLTYSGSSSMFIVKYDASGNPIWAKTGQGADGWSNSAKSVTIDINSNVYMTGSFSSTTVFGTDTLKNTNSGRSDMFIVKYDTLGNVLWAKSASAYRNLDAKSIAVDANGNTYVVGTFESDSVTFGSTTLHNVVDGSGNGGYSHPDMFIVKYDTSGNPIWAKSAGGTVEDIPYSVAVDINGYIYVAGYFVSHSITFGANTFTNASHTYFGDVFFLKLDNKLPCSISLTSGNATSQRVCKNAAIADITYSVSAATTGAIFSGLPTGVTGTLASNIITISGTPSVSGIFNYTVTITGACPQNIVTGSITVNASNAISLISAVGSDSPTVCVNTGIKDIYYRISDGATGASATGLPTGVYLGFIGFPTKGDYSIRGVPSVVGTFIYTVTSTGVCAPNNAMGSITITPIPLVTVNNVTICKGQQTTLTASGATSYVWSGGSTANSLTVFPTINPTTYTVIGTAGGCSGSAMATVIVNPTPNSSFTVQSVCVGSGSVINYTGTAPANGTYNWNFGTGTILSGSGQGPYSVSWPTAGTPNVVLTVSVGNCTSPIEIHSVAVTPIPNVTVNSATICEGNTTSLTASGANTYTWSGSAINPLTVSPTSTTSYTVIGTDANGCSSSTIGTITVNPYGTNCYPHYTTTYDTVNNVFILNVDSITSTNATSYYWNFGDGSTSTLATPTHVYAVDTVYYVCLKIKTLSNDSFTYCHQIGKDYLGNIYRTNGFTINVVNSNLQTGMSSLSSNENSVRIFPNPTNGETEIMFDHSINNVSIKVMNVTGQKILENTSVSGSRFSIDISNQSAGIYFVEVLSEGNVYRQKLIKQ